MPNEVSSTKKNILDWRGQCLQDTCFTNLEIVPRSKRLYIGASLLHCVKTEGNQTGSHYNVAGAFVLICPLQEAFDENLLSSTESPVKNFILDGAVFLMREYKDNGSNSEERPIIMSVLKKRVEKSKSFSFASKTT